MKVAAAILAVAAAGLVALVGVAAVSARPVLFLGAGLAVFLTAAAAGVALATRGRPRQPRRQRVVAFAVGTLAGVAVFTVTALLPAGDARLPPPPVGGQRFWRLPTGSRIAYVRVPARATPRRTPVVFLHGGPGVADMAGDAAHFGQLARDGYDVWVYDQVGTGRSSRLRDPRQYTIARDVADLEAIRQRIGADRLVLIGHSWGAQVAAGYMAAHPTHVAKAVFVSPGALAPAPDDGSGGLVRGRLITRQQLGLYALLLRPRVLLAYSLLQVNPEAAHAFVGDAEMDARNDRVYNHSRPALHCRGAPVGPALHGLGFYANQRAGHNAYQDQPAAFLATVSAFLAGRCPSPHGPRASLPATKAPRSRTSFDRGRWLGRGGRAACGGWRRRLPTRAPASGLASGTRPAQAVRAAGRCRRAGRGR
jgi:proline iminopeptidase